MLTTLVTILIFLLMISLHEFGHFIFGKMLGFTVLEYAIGFGPTIFKKQKGETLYSFRLIPFGGFCRFAGEDETNLAEKGNFNEQSCPKRILVLMAGAVFNVLLGFVIYAIIIVAGKTIYTNTIEKIVPNTYLADTGVQAGDTIVNLNGKHIGMYQDVQLYTSNLDDSSIVEMTVERDGEKKEITFKPSKQHIDVLYAEDEIIYTEILNDEKTVQKIEYSEVNPKNPSKIGTTESMDRYLIGFQPKQEEVTALNLLPETFRMTKFVVKLLYKSVWDMIAGKISVDQMSGPVGVVSEVNNAVHSGSGSVMNVLNLVALLTINLGVFNLLPVPALDGGRLLFVLIEWVRGKPVSREKEGLVHTIGFMLLIGFMIFISYKDILKLFINK